jgi:hypothetical protein
VTGEAGRADEARAKEAGIHFVAGGHYATETLGVRALAAKLADEFGLQWEFVDLPNPSRKPLRTSRARLGELADHEVPGRGRTRIGALQPARVLEAVSDRHEPVAGAPEEECRAADAVEVGTGVVCEQSAARAADVGVLRRAFEEADDRVGDRAPRGRAAPHRPNGSQRSRGRCAKVPRKRVITCAGRRAAVTASQISARRVVETMPAGATSASAVTSSGASTASRSATTPPME